MSTTMSKTTPSIFLRSRRAIAYAVAGTLAFGVAAPTLIAPAFAQDHRDDHRDDRRDEHRSPDHRAPERAAPMRNEHWDWRGDRRFGGPPHAVAIHPGPGFHAYRGIPIERSRWFHNVYVYRPYGIAYPGFGFYYSDVAAARFLGLTALSFVALDELSEAQERAHEEAMVEATSAPVGEAITWNQAGARGSVTAVREGQTPDGRQCREFQQNVMIGGQPQEAYGTACMQPDGSWQVVNQG